MFGRRKVGLPYSWLDKLDAAFFTFSALSAAWLAVLLVSRGVRGGWQALLLVVFWLFFTYLFLPRMHRILTRLYTPGYFIGRARTSDGLLGDPVNLAWLGSEGQVHHAMQRAGWIRADDVDLRSSWRIVSSTIARHSYPEAPVSPLVLFDRQQDFAYQQEVAGSPSKRHHVRFWRCPEDWMLPGGYPVDWLAAGTYDRSVGLSLFTLQVTHKIEENTDVERDFIVDSVVGSDPAATVAVIENCSSGYHARNGGGDRIETDGDLPVVDLRQRPGRDTPAAAETDSRDRRPAPTTFAVVVTFLRGLMYLAGSAALISIPDTYVTIIDRQAGRAAAHGVQDLEVFFAVLLLAAAVIDCGLALAILAGRNWARIVLMALCVTTISAAFVYDVRGTEAVGLTRLPMVGSSILVLLALSSHRSRDFATRRWSRSIPSE